MGKENTDGDKGEDGRYELMIVALMGIHFQTHGEVYNMEEMLDIWLVFWVGILAMHSPVFCLCTVRIRF